MFFFWLVVPTNDINHDIWGQRLTQVTYVTWGLVVIVSIAMEKSAMLNGCLFFSTAKKKHIRHSQNSQNSFHDFPEAPKGRFLTFRKRMGFFRSSKERELR